jgi:hypothetical protein
MVGLVEITDAFLMEQARAICRGGSDDAILRAYHDPRNPDRLRMLMMISWPLSQTVLRAVFESDCAGAQMYAIGMQAVSDEMLVKVAASERYPLCVRTKAENELAERLQAKLQMNHSECLRI